MPGLNRPHNAHSGCSRLPGRSGYRTRSRPGQTAKTPLRPDVDGSLARAFCFASFRAIRRSRAASATANPANRTAQRGE